MITKKNCTKQKLLGSYYTPYKLAQKIASFFMDDPSIQSILEPACGDGVFLDALLETSLADKTNTITAIEIDAAAAKTARKKVMYNPNIDVLHADFFEFYHENKSTRRYDLILANPPYIRYQYLSKMQREVMSHILTDHGMKSNKLSNAWVGFMAACVHMLSENGKMAFIVPADILQVSYAKELRHFLSEQFQRITLFAFEELIFPDVEQDIVVFFGEKGDFEKGIRIINRKNLNDLDYLDLSMIAYQKRNDSYEKWTNYFLTGEENQVLLSLMDDKRFQRLSDTGTIQVGITTGNNTYFSVDQDTVTSYDLSDAVRPLIGRSFHCNGLYYHPEDWKKNAEQGKNVFLIDFSKKPKEEYTSGQRSYIAFGEWMGIHKGYKCRIRQPWYQVPTGSIPDAFFLRRCHAYPKFFLNCCDAVSTDTMNRICFHESEEPERILLSYYNSISFAFTEICGLNYGAGALELLPKETGSILVPVLNGIPIQEVKRILSVIDQMIREDAPIETVLDLVDKEILIGYLHIDANACETARNIWGKLQSRRQNRYATHKIDKNQAGSSL